MIAKTTEMGCVCRYTEQPHIWSSCQAHEYTSTFIAFYTTDADADVTLRDRSFLLGSDVVYYYIHTLIFIESMLSKRSSITHT